MRFYEEYIKIPENITKCYINRTKQIQFNPKSVKIYLVFVGQNGLLRELLTNPGTYAAIYSYPQVIHNITTYLWISFNYTYNYLYIIQ